MNGETTVETTSEEATATAPVVPLVMASCVIIRKWHEGNGQYEQCTLKELWENGFHGGQSFQANNKHFHKEAVDVGGFYATSEFLESKWKAFWHDLKDAEILVIKP